MALIAVVFIAKPTASLARNLLVANTTNTTTGTTNNATTKNYPQGYSGCYPRAPHAVKSAGVGTVPSECSTSKADKQDSLCYTPCKDGYSASTATTCSKDCDEDFSPSGFATCIRSAKSYGNGCRGNCRDGYKNTGCTCFRPAATRSRDWYSRGAGISMDCGNKSFSDGLCYKSCPSETHHVGPLCWSNVCPSDHQRCGVGLCTIDRGSCILYNSLVGSAAGLLIGSVAVCVLSGGLGCPAAAAGLEVGLDVAVAAGELHIKNHCD